MPLKKSPPWPAPRGLAWTAGAPVRLLENPWFAVDHYKAVAPTGAPADYYVQNFKAQAVGALPLHPDGSVTLVGQWRFPLGLYSWEAPEGGAPMTEPALDGARRELLEETGLVAASWRQILTLQLSNASSDERAYGFLATDLTAGSSSPDPTEELALERVPFHAALKAVADGVIQDAITVAMLLRVHQMAYAGELDPPLAAAVLAGERR